MASPPSDRRRWQLVLDAGDGARNVHLVSNEAQADGAMAGIREAIRQLMKRGGCRSLVIGVHVEGAECDHELGGAG